MGFSRIHKKARRFAGLSSVYVRTQRRMKGESNHEESRAALSGILCALRLTSIIGCRDRGARIFLKISSNSAWSGEPNSQQ